MSTGELMTRLPIWVMLTAYFIGAVLLTLSHRRPQVERAARWAWTIAVLSLLIHVGCAYHFYHRWSQESAYRETARQTAQLTGIEWGGGLYINYFLILCWMIDVGWWWRGLEQYRRRSATLAVIWQGFLIFVIFNATVVFKTGALRFIGIVLCGILCLLWLFEAVNRSSEKSSEALH
jgi:hypothetical protein